MKKIRFSNFYIGLILVIMYLPILLIVVYSFNESKISSVWGGFSLKWYEMLKTDRAMHEAIGNSLLLGVLSCSAEAVIGTIWAFGMSRIKLRTKGMV